MDALFAQLMSVLANVNRAKRQRPYTADQFMPKWDPEAPPERKAPMSGDEILKSVKSYQRTMGGKERG